MSFARLAAGLWYYFYTEHHLILYAPSLGSVEEQYLSCASLRNHTKKARQLSSARTSVQATIKQLDLIFNVPCVVV